jgi:hypothetical protein
VPFPSLSALAYSAHSPFFALSDHYPPTHTAAGAAAVVRSLGSFREPEQHPQSGSSNAGISGIAGIAGMPGMPEDALSAGVSAAGAAVAGAAAAGAASAVAVSAMPESGYDRLNYLYRLVPKI